jgi:hypothetical protein
MDQKDSSLTVPLVPKPRFVSFCAGTSNGSYRPATVFGRVVAAMQRVLTAELLPIQVPAIGLGATDEH